MLTELFPTRKLFFSCCCCNLLVPSYADPPLLASPDPGGRSGSTREGLVPEQGLEP